MHRVRLIARSFMLTFAAVAVTGLFPAAGYATEELLTPPAEAAPATTSETTTSSPPAESSPAPVEIRIFSEDQKVLHQTAAQIEESIKKVTGVVDTNSGVVVSGAAVTFKINPQSAARFGASPNDIANTVTAAMTGDASSAILEKGRLIAVRVILPQSARQSLDILKALQIRSVSGQLFRLDQVADVEYEQGQTEIERDGLRQSVAVTARITGADLGTTIAKIKAQLAKDVKLPIGMTLEYGGLYQEQQSSFRELAFAPHLSRARARLASPWTTAWISRASRVACRPSTPVASSPNRPP